MLMILTLVGSLAQGTAVTLPSTPQGKVVAAFVTAFRAGEPAFLNFQEQHMLSGQKRTLEERKAMYARMRKNFGDFKFRAVRSASAEQITLAVAHAEGEEAAFTFRFESAAPYRITEIAVEVE